MKKFLDVFYSRNFLVYMAIGMLIFTGISFSIAGMTAKNTVISRAAAVSSAASDINALTQIESGLLAYNEALRYVRNIPEKNSRKKTYPEFKAPALKGVIDGLSDRKIAAALEDLLFIKYKGFCTAASQFKKRNRFYTFQFNRNDQQYWKFTNNR